jgi:broad specificity phosphatase PhoE
MGTPLYQIYLFRHGQTDWNREGRIQGHVDVPLNDSGRAEADRLAHGLRRIRLDAILTSDLSRAKDTATLALAEASRNAWHPIVPIFSDSRFREVSLGKLQGLTKPEIREKFGDEFADFVGAKILSDEDLRDLGSESGNDVLARFFSGIEDAIRQFDPGTRFGVCSHGGVLRRLLHHAAGIEKMPPVPNAAFFPFHYEAGQKAFRFQDRIEWSRT